MEELTDKIKAFVLWLCDLKCPFDVTCNGINKSKPRILFRKGMQDKDWTIEEVWNYWCENVFEKHEK